MFIPSLLARRSRRGRGPVMALGAAMALLLSLSACNSGSGAEAGDGDGSLIGVSFATQAQERWNFEAGVIKKVAAENGDRVLVNFAGDSTSKQISQIESMVQRGIKVLILSPVDAAALGPVAKQAQRQGVKVITYDRDIADAKPDYILKKDFAQVGRFHAESALKAVPCGKYAIIRGDPALKVPYDLMSKGPDELLLKNDCIDVVYDEDTPNWDSAVAQANAEAALQRDPDIDVFVAMWDGASQGVVQALKGAGKKPGDVYVTGTDAATPNLVYMAEGWQSETVWTPIDEMAKYAANLAHTFATDGDIPAPDETVDGVPIHNVPVVNVTEDTLCDFITNVAPAGWVTEDEVFGAGKSPC